MKLKLTPLPATVLGRLVVRRGAQGIQAHRELPGGAELDAETQRLLAFATGGREIVEVA